MVSYCQVFHTEVQLWPESGPGEGGKPCENVGRGTSLPGVEPRLYSNDVIEFGIDKSDMQIIYILSLFLKGNIILRQVVIDIFRIVSPVL